MINSKAILTCVLILLLGNMVISAVLAQETTSVSDDEAAGEIVDLTVQAAEDTATTMQGWLDRLLAIPQSDVVRVLLVLGGILLLIVGWRIYDFIVIVAGFLIGASVAVSLLTTDNSLITIAALLVGGLIGSALAIFLYYAAVFIIGAYIGVMLTNALVVAIAGVPVSPLILLIGGLIGGLILIGLSFEFLVVLSAIVGAQMLARGLGVDGLWALLFVLAGVATQFVLMRAYRYDFRRHRRVYNFRRIMS